MYHQTISPLYDCLGAPVATQWPRWWIKTDIGDRFLLPEEIVPRPVHDGKTEESNSELSVSWTNEPSFSFSVKRKKTGDTIFSTKGTVLVYEDQFIEFGSPLPENYNLYGLGEVVRGLRLGNNLTSRSLIVNFGRPFVDRL